MEKDFQGVDMKSGMAKKKADLNAIVGKSKLSGTSMMFKAGLGKYSKLSPSIGEKSHASLKMSPFIDDRKYCSGKYEDILYRVRSARLEECKKIKTNENHTSQLIEKYANSSFEHHHSGQVKEAHTSQMYSKYYKFKQTDFFNPNNWTHESNPHISASITQIDNIDHRKSNQPIIRGPSQEKLQKVKRGKVDLDTQEIDANLGGMLRSKLISSSQATLKANNHKFGSFYDSYQKNKIFHQTFQFDPKGLKRRQAEEQSVDRQTLNRSISQFEIGLEMATQDAVRMAKKLEDCRRENERLAAVVREKDSEIENLKGQIKDVNNRESRHLTRLTYYSKFLEALNEILIKPNIEIPQVYEGHSPTSILDHASNCSPTFGELSKDGGLAFELKTILKSVESLKSSLHIHDQVRTNIDSNPLAKVKVLPVLTFSDFEAPPETKHASPIHNRHTPNLFDPSIFAVRLTNE